MGRGTNWGMMRRSRSLVSDCGFAGIGIRAFEETTLELSWMPEALRGRFGRQSESILAAARECAFEGNRRRSFSSTEKGVPGFAFRTLVSCAQSHQSGGSSGRNTRRRVGDGSCAAWDDPQLPEAVRNQYHARSRDRPRRHGSVL
jgi:hypothetical protein